MIVCAVLLRGDGGSAGPPLRPGPAPAVCGRGAPHALVPLPPPHGRRRLLILPAAARADGRGRRRTFGAEVPGDVAAAVRLGLEEPAGRRRAFRYAALRDGQMPSAQLGFDPARTAWSVGGECPEQAKAARLLADAVLSIAPGAHPQQAHTDTQARCGGR